jgi:hypothetical protein
MGQFYATHETTYDNIAEFPMDPPLTVRGPMAVQHVGDGVAVIATDTQVSVYQRDGEAYVLRGQVDLI